MVQSERFSMCERQVSSSQLAGGGGGLPVTSWTVNVEQTETSERRVRKRRRRRWRRRRKVREGTGRCEMRPEAFVPPSSCALR